MVTSTTRKRPAAARKPRPNPVERARAEVAKGAGTVDPTLAAMVAEWVDINARFEARAVPGAEGAAAFARLDQLHRAIYAFPAASVADLCAKLPPLRDELTNLADEGPAEDVTLERLAWRGVIADLERLAGPRPEAETIANVATLDVEPIAELADWTPPTIEDFKSVVVALRAAGNILAKDKAALAAIFEAETTEGDTLSLMETLENNADWLHGAAETMRLAYYRLLVGAAVAVQASEAA